jgi:hypothetical protein
MQSWDVDSKNDPRSEVGSERGSIVLNVCKSRENKEVENFTFRRTANCRSWTLTVELFVDLFIFSYECWRRACVRSNDWNRSKRCFLNNNVYFGGS